MAIIRAYLTAEYGEKPALFQFDLNREMNEEVLASSGFSRVEVWASKDVDLYEKGWMMVLRADGTPIESQFGNRLWAFPGRPSLPEFPA